VGTLLPDLKGKPKKPLINKVVRMLKLNKAMKKIQAQQENSNISSEEIVISKSLNIDQSPNKSRITNK
jgi:hypothetical protein